jgi:vancomycin resistance protein VanJ
MPAEGSLKAVTWLLSLTGIYISFLAAITILNSVGADRFWVGALNFYLPQLMYALPGVVLSILLFRAGSPWGWLPLVCVFWVLGPLMGLKLPLKSADAAPGHQRVRVMTWNIKYGYYDLAPLIAELTLSRPDVVLFQDAVGAMDGPLGDYFGDWQVRSRGQYVIASRFPLSEAEEQELPYFGSKEEKFLRCRMYLGPTAVTLYNVHFMTPRRSLNAFRAARHQPWYLPEAIQRLKHNVRTRFLQAATIFAHLGQEEGPVIVAGDFNSPDPSLVCDTLRNAGLHDSFAERGTGYGFTYGQLLLKHRLPWLQLSWMRIDHIMLSPAFVTERCWTGTGSASDHRPVVADLILNPSPR